MGTRKTIKYNFFLKILIISIFIQQLFSKSVIVPTKTYTGIFIESIYKDILIGDESSKGYDRNMNLLWDGKEGARPPFIIDNNGYRYSVVGSGTPYVLVLNVINGNKTAINGLINIPNYPNRPTSVARLSDNFFIAGNKVVDYNHNILWDANDIIPDTYDALLSMRLINNDGNMVFLNSLGNDLLYLLSQTKLRVRRSLSKNDILSRLYISDI